MFFFVCFNFKLKLYQTYLWKIRGESWFPLTHSLLGIGLFTFSLAILDLILSCVLVFVCVYLFKFCLRRFILSVCICTTLFLFACFGLLYVCVCMCVTYFLDAHILQYILVNLTFLLLLNYSCLGSLHI